MTEVNTGKKAAATLTLLGGKPHLLAEQLPELMLALREDFDWVSTLTRRTLLNEKINGLPELRAFLSNTRLLLHVMDTPVLRQLYRRTLERAVGDMLRLAQEQPEVFEQKEYNDFLVQHLYSSILLARNSGYFDDDNRAYLHILTDGLADVANALRDEKILYLAATLRFFEDKVWVQTFVDSKRTWEATRA